MPGGAESENAPDESVVAVTVVGPVAVTVAPGTAPPAGVSNVPEIVPVADCAAAGPAIIPAIAKLKAAAIMRRRQDVSSKGSPKKL